MSTLGSSIEISEESPLDFREYESVSIAFDVTRVLVPIPASEGLLGLVFREQPMMSPWRKDYDALPGNAPSSWPKQFDVSGWGVLVARIDGERAGGATVASRTPGLLMLEWPRRSRRALGLARTGAPSSARRRSGALSCRRSLGLVTRLCAAQGRNAEHERGRLSLLRGAGVLAARGRRRRLPRLAWRGPAAVAQGPSAVCSTVVNDEYVEALR
jgi:hypothetical protein